MLQSTQKNYAGYCLGVVPICISVKTQGSMVKYLYGGENERTFWSRMGKTSSENRWFSSCESRCRKTGLELQTAESEKSWIIVSFLT